MPRQLQRSLRYSFLLILAITLAGCTPKEKEAAILDLTSALNDLVQNRSLTEQFVKDVKATSAPSDPRYMQAVESYQHARETYHSYIDMVEAGEPLHTRSLRGTSPVEVQNATADFLADALSILKPEVNTRHLRFQRTIIIPDNLTTTIGKLNKKTREQILDRIDPQVRWRTWGEL